MRSAGIRNSDLEAGSSADASSAADSLATLTIFGLPRPAGSDKR